MKKFVSFVTFAMLMVATCFSFAACGDGDDEEGGSGKTNTSPAKFKVVDPAAVDIRDFSFWTDGDFAVTLPEGEAQTYYVVCHKLDGETWYRPSGVTFSSSNDYVATVEKKGEGIVVLTAKSTGKVSLKATLPNNNEISVTLTITGKKPKTSDEARKMLQTYWTTDAYDELPSDLTFKERLSSDGTVWHFYTVKPFPEPTTEWWRRYPGETVGYKVGEYTVTPDGKDPTRGTIVYVDDESGDKTTVKYRNLCATSFEQISVEDLEYEVEPLWALYTRTTAPSGVSYIKNPW